MINSLAQSCPECGSQLPAEDQRARSCSSCGRSYVNWFGNLIPDQSAPAAELPAA